MVCYMYSSMEWAECPIMYRPIAVCDQGLKLKTIYELIIEYTDLTHAHMHRCSIKLERCVLIPLWGIIYTYGSTYSRNGPNVPYM